MEDIWKDLATLPSDTLAAATAAAAAAADAAGASGPPLSRLSHQEFLSTSWSATTLQSDNDAHSLEISPNPFSLETALKIGTTFSKRRGSPRCDQEDVDRKRKRIVKNRESAVRSRARRQAYTYHLEAKISLLKEENAELRKQQQQCKILEQVQEESRKLQRSLTAPF